MKINRKVTKEFDALMNELAEINRKVLSASPEAQQRMLDPLADIIGRTADGKLKDFFTELYERVKSKIETGKTDSEF